MRNSIHAIRGMSSGAGFQEEQWRREALAVLGWNVKCSRSGLYDTVACNSMGVGWMTQEISFLPSCSTSGDLELS